MNKEFWKALMIRVAKTWCQAFVGVIGVDTMRTLGEVNWLYALSVATTAAIICFVWNLGIGLPEVDGDASDDCDEIDYLEDDEDEDEDYEDEEEME